MLTPSPKNIVTELIAQYEQSAPRLAANTVQSYRYDWNLFAAWTERLGRCALPATEETVALFLVDCRRSLDMVRTYYRQANLLKVNAAGSIGL